MENINRQISYNLKQIRKEKGITLDELAEVSGVSKSMLSEIERGGTNPTILVLWKIADGLKIPLTRLISETEMEYMLVRNSDQKVISQTNAYEIASIFPYHEAHKSEILRLELSPHAKLANNGHLNCLDEVILVIEGKLRLALNNETFALNEGDAIRFKGELAHELNNDQDRRAILINVLHYR